VIEFLFYYGIFAVCTGVATIFNVWMPMRKVFKGVVPTATEDLNSFSLIITWFIVGIIFAPYLFWQTLFGPTESFTESIFRALFSGKKK